MGEPAAWSARGALDETGAVPGLPPDWPNRRASRFVEAAGLRWHVQCAGPDDRPVLLLLHGTGAATNSWRDLIPRLAGEFRVVAPDLPGHGFTSAMPAGEASLPRIAQALAALMQALGCSPVFIAGHSAGAALGARMALAETPAVRRLACLAGALRPLDGFAGRIAPSLAHVLARSALAQRWVAWRADDDAAVRRFVTATGSTLDAGGLATYRELLRRPAHVAGALAMMAAWDLAPLQRALPSLGIPVLLLHGDNDRTVPSWQSDDLARRLAHARLRRLPGLGHLAHEERPAEVARLVAHWFSSSD